MSERQYSYEEAIAFTRWLVETGVLKQAEGAELLALLDDLAVQVAAGELSIEDAKLIQRDRIAAVGQRIRERLT